MKTHWLSKVYKIHSASPVLKFKKAFEQAKDLVHGDVRTPRGLARIKKARAKFAIARDLATQARDTADKNIKYWKSIHYNANQIRMEAEGEVIMLSEAISMGEKHQRGY